MTPSVDNNERIVKDLRDALAVVIERLTPEIEPATIFVLYSREADEEE